MLEICIQTSYDQNVQLILKSYLPVVYGTTLSSIVILIDYEIPYNRSFAHFILDSIIIPFTQFYTNDFPLMQTKA